MLSSSKYVMDKLGIDDVAQSLASLWPGALDSKAGIITPVEFMAPFFLLLRLWGTRRRTRSTRMAFGTRNGLGEMQPAAG